jgi:uncharacterized membrane protein YgcG
MGGLLSFAVQQASAQNVNNFTISHFEADYYLSQDSEGRSQLKTVEKITAKFPNYDQNHGLERAIPQKYDGHSTSLTIESVASENGRSLPYSDYTSNDNLILRVGDADTYVHGEQTYVITYTQRDVTRFFADTNDDEFYRDINGTEWRVLINALEARVHVASPLSDKMTNQASCYQGAVGATTQCSLQQEPNSSGGMLISTHADSLKAGETVTLALGFQPRTFAEYQPSWQERLVMLWGVIAVISAVVAIIVIVWLGIKYHKIMRRTKGRDTIIPEYLPPKDASVLASSQVLKNSSFDMTAQLIDLAVRHYLKIYQTREKTLWKQAEYELEVAKNPTGLRVEERGLLEDLFGADLKPGDRFAMNELQKSHALRKKLLERRKTLRQAARGEYGLFERAQNDARWFNRAGVVLLIVGLAMLSPLMLVAAIVAFSLAYSLWPLTEKGAELKGYLEGLKLYVTVAEKERLKMLQSPEGAEKVGKMDGKDTKRLVKLYERVLPYAVLFGVEKEWTKQLGVYYETAHAQPDWYVGHGVFNAAVFSSAVSGFSSVSSSYSSSSSASTGGSGGGGSAGGGGGGGGGGGW